ncbi:GGDEF domain-containing protein [Lachnobacterium bovis]|uniref:Diguanylate cyclase (GGDEF) domain-containing protein n=1 Tax=Lachnobacterium bovis TaxID=140626 RepID=A0A1H9R3L8_9FIRM|nr:GGDEF domain-containing protein [Lachnobacterium bovis]SER66639.1 diguanylate cyclase (GGDEF) domain-containing protein [Lachnobacterium bovis]
MKKISNRTRKIFYWIEVIIVSIIFFLMIASNFLKYNQEFNLNDEKQKIEVIKPKKVVKMDGLKTLYVFDRDEILKKGKMISFFTNRLEVDAYVDGEKIYSCHKVNSKYGETTGNVWNQVIIRNDIMNDVYIYTKYETRINNIKNIHFLIGDKSLTIKTLLEKYFLELMVSIIVIIIGLYICANFAFATVELDQSDGAMYCGIVLVLLGIWAVNESHIVTMFYRNSVARYFTSYLIIMLIPYPLLIFFSKYYNRHNKVVHFVVGIGYILNIIFSLLFQLAGIFELHQSVIVTHMLCLIVIVDLMYTGIITIKQNMRHQRHSIGAVVEIIGLFLSIISIIIIYYFVRFDTYMYAITMIIIVSSIIWGKLAGNRSKLLDEKQRLEYYYNLAEKDVLTGLKNRNSYERWMRERQRKINVAIITYDLNDLKKTNDVFGHLEGDTYIIEAAKIIDKVFNEVGESYRIGGDEFCTIITNKLDMPISKYINTIKLLQEMYNRTEPAIIMNIAIGYAIFDKNIDNSLEDTRDRADAMMYKNKRRLKNKNGPLEVE